jgi:SAM-dependent methyltransferase
MTQPATVERFTRVDATADPNFFVRFVDAANEMASVQACKRRMEAMLQPRVGQRILDLGCGTGDDARALARLVAPGGRVVGVDNSEVMLAEARRRAMGLVCHSSTAWATLSGWICPTTRSMALARSGPSCIWRRPSARSPR